MSSETTELKIAVEEPKSWSRRLSITVPADRVRRTRGANAAQLAGNLRLPGFRKGKMPTRLIEQRYGASIDQETIDRMIQEAYREALEQSGFSPVSQGKVEKVQYEPDAELTFEVEFEVQPDIVLEQTSGFSATRPTSEITEEDVDAVLERLREERLSWEPADEGTRPDWSHQVVVSITALEEDGEAEEPRSYRFVLGEGQAIPEIEESILTLSAGEEGEFTIHFPDDYPDESQRGAEQRLRIRLEEVHTPNRPELDDEFAKAIGDFESLEALRNRIREDLSADAVNRAESEVRRQLVEQILEANPFEVPDSMVERYLQYMMGDQAEPRERSEEEQARFLQVQEALRPQAESGLKRMLVVERLAQQEGLAATQDEIDARVEELAEKHGRTPSEVWIQLEKTGQLEVLEREITEEKVYGFLKERNTVEG